MMILIKITIIIFSKLFSLNNILNNLIYLNIHYKGNCAKNSYLFENLKKLNYYNIYIYIDIFKFTKNNFKIKLNGLKTFKVLSIKECRGIVIPEALEVLDLIFSNIS